MNDADFAILNKQFESIFTDRTVATNLDKLQAEMDAIRERIKRLEEATFVPPGGWDLDDDEDMLDPPF